MADRLPRAGEVWDYGGGKYTILSVDRAANECAIQHIGDGSRNPHYSLDNFIRVSAIASYRWTPPVGRTDPDGYEVLHCVCGGAYVLSPGEDFHDKCEACR